MKYLGIDYGTKNIGVAVSDNTGRVAFPLTTLHTNSSSIEEIIAIAQKNDVDSIVLGESHNFKDEPNSVMDDIRILYSGLHTAGYTVDYEPEFMTSVLAAREGSSPEQLDASAAALILQSYLDRNKSIGDVE